MNVRITPKSGHGSARSRCPLCAISKTLWCDSFQSARGTIKPNPAISNNTRMILRKAASSNLP
jgi:hypothetical protein